MRPIELRIAGLNSYRQEECIDFEVLGNLNLFGVFGPVGAGKSTILDAITLALFGKVKRSGGISTSGIINQHEKELYVSFKFSLGIGNNCQLYNIERVYKRKRNTEHAVESKLGRLIKIGNPDKVLADKEREITTKIRELLGLDEKDFLRAIVLPQGHFAEFLQLSGRERRDSLQRLFGLESYGNCFYERVKKECLSLTNELDSLDSYSTKLEVVSSETIKIAEQNLRIAEYFELDTRKFLAVNQKKYLEANEITILTNKAIQIELDLNKLQSKKDFTGQQHRKLKIAKDAKKVNEIVIQVQEINSICENSKRKLQDAQTKLDLTTSQFEKASLSLKESVNLKKRQLQQYIQTIQSEINKQELSRKEFLEKVSKVCVNTYNQSDMLSLENMKWLTNLKYLIENLDKQYNLLSSTKIELKEIEKKYNLEKKNVKTINEKNNLVDLELCKLEEEHSYAKNDLKKQKNIQVAAQLAETLQENQPCPVCGSASHPLPTVLLNKITVDSLSQRCQDLTERLNLLKQNKNSIGQENIKHIARTDELSLYRDKIYFQIIQIQQQIKATRQELPKDWSLFSIADLYDKFSEIDFYCEQINEKTKVLHSFNSDLAKLNKDLSKIDTELFSQEKSALENLKDNIQESKIEVAKLQTLFQEMIRQFSLKNNLLKQLLNEFGFIDEATAQSSLLSNDELTELEEIIAKHELDKQKLVFNQNNIKNELAGRSISNYQLERIANDLEEAEEANRKAIVTHELARTRYEEINSLKKLKKESQGKILKLDLLKNLEKLLEGNQFVEFMAEEYLQDMTRDASFYLEKLSHQRYSLQVGTNAEFIICDNFSAGFQRPTSTLSGGETFLVSLSLALALSTQIQLRGNNPLEFFFLDEGFGLLDADSLDTVLDSFETLRRQNLLIGLISHVEELKYRIPICLLVEPGDFEFGTRLKIKNPYLV